MPLCAGDMLGDYRVLDLLGSGGMGHVYKVQNILSNRVEAMKVVLPDKADELTERFLREIQVQASLVHPNITGLHTALRVDGQLVMIMELVEGECLKDRLERGPLRIGECVEYGRQILDALGYAHRRQVVHRDIKPANIMLSSGGQAKLMDFGLASGSFDKRLTRTGTVMGSLYYMAPEQVKGQQLSSRSDLYSFGLTLYEMLTGVRGIQGDSDYAIMTAHLQTDPEAPMLCNPAVPRYLSDVVMCAVAKDPEARFASAEDFRDALERFARLAPEPALESTAVEIEDREIASSKVPATPPETGPAPTAVRADDAVTAALSALPQPHGTGSARAVPPPHPERPTIANLPSIPYPPSPAIPIRPQAPPLQSVPVEPMAAAPAPIEEPGSPPASRPVANSGPVARKIAPEVSVPEGSVAEPKRKSSGTLIVVGAAAAVVLASVGVYRYVTAPKEDAPSHVAQGDIVSPRSPSGPADGTAASSAKSSSVLPGRAVTAPAVTVKGPAPNVPSKAQPVAIADPRSVASGAANRTSAATPETVKPPVTAASSKQSVPSPPVSSVVSPGAATAERTPPPSTSSSFLGTSPAPAARAAAPASVTPALVVEGPKPPQKSAEQLRAEEAARAWELVASSTDSIALRAFHDRYPQSAHAAEALNIAERIENHAAALAESRKASEAAAALRQEVSVVLQRIQEAYSARDAKQIRAVWPTIDSDHLKRLETAIRETRSMSLVLQPTSEPRRTRNGAVVECRYVQLSALKGSKAPRQMEGTATVILTRSGGSLVIDDIDYRLTSRSLFKPL